VMGGEGKWVLAKCRMRRLVDPELVSGSEIPVHENVARLNLRLVEDGWVPEDVAIYCEAALERIDFGNDCRLDLAVVGVKVPAVYLVTWHRDRWGTAKPSWRPLVKIYSTDQKFRVWEAQPVVYREVGKTDFEAASAGQINLTLSAHATVRRLAVSDYTESRWLTFIGSFGKEAPVPKESLKIRHIDGAFVLSPTDGVGEATKWPELFKAGDLRSSLLLVFEPRRDLMRGEFAQDGGALRGVYAMREQPNLANGSATFDLALLRVEGNSKGCKAVLIQLQRHNVETTTPEWSMVENSWPDMVNAMFPRQKEDGSGSEASLRFLPEFIGEITID
jgi:hypothetical protein